MPSTAIGPKLRQRSDTFNDHYSQARQFYRSQTAPEQRHISMALAFELGKVDTKAIRQRMLGHLCVLDEALAADVAARLGADIHTVPATAVAVPPQDLPESPALSTLATRSGGLAGCTVAALVANGAALAVVKALRDSLEKAGATLVLVCPTREGALLADGTRLDADAALAGAPSCLYDAVVVLGSTEGIKPLKAQPDALNWLRDAWRHLKVVGLDAGGSELAKAAGIGSDDAVLTVDNKRTVDNFCQWAARGKHLAREGAPGTDA